MRDNKRTCRQQLSSGIYSVLGKAFSLFFSHQTTRFAQITHKSNTFHHQHFTTIQTNLPINTSKMSDTGRKDFSTSEYHLDIAQLICLTDFINRG